MSSASKSLFPSLQTSSNSADPKIPYDYLFFLRDPIAADSSNASTEPGRLSLSASSDSTMLCAYACCGHFCSTLLLLYDPKISLRQRAELLCFKGWLLRSWLLNLSSSSAIRCCRPTFKADSIWHWSQAAKLRS